MVPSNEVSLSLSPSDDNIHLAGHSGRGEREGKRIQNKTINQPKRTKIPKLGSKYCNTDTDTDTTQITQTECQTNIQRELETDIYRQTIRQTYNI